MSAKHTPTPWEIEGPYLLHENTTIAEVWDTSSYSPREGSIPTPDEGRSNAEFIVEAVNAYEKLKTDNAKLQETISELQIQNSKGLYTPLHETERRKLKADNAALLEAAKGALWCAQRLWDDTKGTEREGSAMGAAATLESLKKAIAQAKSEVRE